MLARHFWLISILIIIHQLLCVSTSPLERRLLDSDSLIKEVGGKLFTGRGTFYEVGIGSCGEQDTDDDLVVAVNKKQMANGANPNNNPQCDKMVSITGHKGSTLAKIVDTCPSCSFGALDMSPKVFKKVCGSLNEGVCRIEWKFV
ncbi:MAG: hypothetical protein EXX96DRAFT_588221 [Benjaminiella poitrasii]|nr:MAG: hypothetical protein EXX96DRAFT_588221 [Benjaminiella poitrasii]